MSDVMRVLSAWWARWVVFIAVALALDAVAWRGRPRANFASRRRARDATTWRGSAPRRLPWRSWVPRRLPWRSCAPRRLPWRAALTAAALVIASFLSRWAQRLFDRPRPPLGHVGITAIGHLPHTPGFPSGHATTAFAAASALARLQRSKRVAWAVRALAAAIAFSRVYLGVHYLGDVIAGALLGEAIGAVVATVARRLWFAPAASPPAVAGDTGRDR